MSSMVREVDRTAGRVSREYGHNRFSLKALSVILMSVALAQPASLYAQSSSAVQTAPDQQTQTKSTAIIGLEGAKENTQGVLTIEGGKLCFAHSGIKSQIPTAAMEDVITAEDSQRAVRGALGTISQIGPYGSGRVISMFRSKIDTLTIEYRDNTGALHGVIFTTPAGTADSLKQQLISQGARTTAPVAATASTASEHQAAAEGK